MSHNVVDIMTIGFLFWFKIKSGFFLDDIKTFKQGDICAHKNDIFLHMLKTVIFIIMNYIALFLEDNVCFVV